MNLVMWRTWHYISHVVKVQCFMCSKAPHYTKASQIHILTAETVTESKQDFQICKKSFYRDLCNLHYWSVRWRSLGDNSTRSWWWYCLLNNNTWVRTRKQYIRNLQRCWTNYCWCRLCSLLQWCFLRKKKASSVCKIQLQTTNSNC